MPSTLPNSAVEADAVDEFFGDDDDAFDRLGGLAAAEDRALEERFRNVGYHETYEECQEERLQEGFEVGYTQAFTVATEIGTRLGRSVLQGQWDATRTTRTTTPTTPPPTTTSGTTTAAYKQISKLIKERLTAPDLSLEALQNLQKELEEAAGDATR
jgi:flagellar biosynthesis/type III secretory pathway protein FliH